MQDIRTGALIQKYFCRSKVYLLDIPDICKDIRELRAQFNGSADALVFDNEMKKLVRKWRVDERSHFKAAD
jgi:hypothetical protein